MIEVRNVTSGYGQSDVLRSVSLEIEPTEIVSIIGANGAGKSTLVNTISGVTKCRSGSIFFQKRDITNMRPEKIVSLGIIQVPEGRQVIAPLTVQENLLLGAYSRYRSMGKNGRQKIFDVVYGMFPILQERRRQLAGTLSGGEQQMLAVARALMGQPKLLLCDEPSLGLAPLVIEAIVDVLRNLNQNGLPMMLVEENALVALNLANRAYVMEVGSVVLEGKASDLLHNDMVRKIYIGESRTNATPINPLVVP
jgi:branched-chain amino acid transport system ATP-binding protein